MGISGLGEREVDGGSREIVALATLVEEVVDVMGEQDRALRMSAGEREQLVDRTARIQTVSSQQRFDVASCLVNREGRQFQRSRLAVKRSFPVGEQGSHRGRLTPGEDIGSGRRMVLDHRTEETVEGVVGDEQVLKLIQTHDRHAAVGRVEAQRDVEKLEQGRACLISPPPRSTRSD